MSELFGQELARAMSERERRAELLRRRQAFVRRLQERTLEKPPERDGGGILDAITPDILGLAISQIATAMKSTPRGIYEMVRAPTLDIKDLLTEGDITPERTGHLAKETVKQVYQDFRHPLRNPGYLALDLLSLAPTPLAAVGKGTRATAAFRAARKGETLPETARTPLPHGRAAPKDGGEGGAVEHPVGLVNDPDAPPDTPGPLGRPSRPPKWERIEEVKVKGTGRKKGIRAYTEPLEDGTYYGLNYAPSEQRWTIVRFGEGMGKNQQRVGRVFDDPKEALASLRKEAFLEGNQMGKWAPPEYTIKDAQREIMEAESRELNEMAGITDADLEPPKPKKGDFVEEARKWVEETPDRKITVTNLREMFGVRTAEAKQIRDKLRAAKVITKSGFVSKARRTEIETLAAEQAKSQRSGFSVTERGSAPLDDLDAMGQYAIPDNHPDMKVMAEKVLADDYDPVELRYNADGDLYLHDGHLRVAAAKQAGIDDIRYEIVEKSDAEPIGAPIPEDQQVAKPVSVKADDIGEPIPQPKAVKLTDDEMFEVVRSMPVYGTPTVKMIERRLQIGPKKAGQLRDRLIKERPDPDSSPLVRGTDPPVVPVTRKTTPIPKDQQVEAARRLMFEEGATAAEISRRTGMTLGAARKAVTAVNKERTKTPKMITPHERKVAREKIAALWKEEGKQPTIKAVQEKTGYGYDRSKKLLTEVAKEKHQKVVARDTLRGKGTNDRALGVNPRMLKAAGIPEKFQGPIRAGIRKLYTEGVVQPPGVRQIENVFRLTLGDEAGRAAFRRWNQARIKSGGAASAGERLGPASTREALGEAWKEFKQPNRGGSYLLAIATRNRNTRRLRDVIDNDTGEVVTPRVQMVLPDDVPEASTKKLIQRRNLETLPVEVALSDNVAIKKFQQHRYKWMAKEASSRVERVYAKLIKATPRDAVKHIEYQLRELDRIADSIEKARVIPLTEAGFVAQLKRAYEERAKEVRLQREHETSAGGAFGRAIDTVNQLAIIGTLYAKPAYLTPNLIGQAFLITADHFLNPLRLLDSMKLRNASMGKTNATTARQSQMIKAAMHEGIVGSIEVKGGASARVAGVHQAMSLFYSRLMDDWFREVSFFNEAKRHGFDTPDKINSLFSAENQGKFIEISRRANANIIDFGRMTAGERTVMRRLIFFYPWVKASSFYTARFPTQHPFQTMAIVGASREGQEKTEKELGPLPSYLEGAFKGPDVNIPGFGNLGERTMPDGSKKPRIINPAAASIFGSLGEVMDAVRANALGEVRESEQLSDFLSPAVSLAASVIFRRDPFTGREFPSDMSLADILTQEAGQYLAPLDAYRDTRDAKKFATGERDPDEVLFPYTGKERVARFVGGITPYTLNQKEARSRAFAERRGLQDKQKRETMKYIERRENLLQQAKEVGILPRSATQLPKEVREAFTVRAAREANLVGFEVELGRDLTNVDRLYADLSLLVRQKKMPKKLAERILEQVKGLPDPMVDAVARQIRERHFGTAIISHYTKAINDRRTAMGRERVTSG